MSVLLNPQSPEQMELACYHLRRGDPVGVPSETVYGLAAPYDDPRALAQIFRLKNRPEFDPLIVHVAHDWDIAPLIRSQNAWQEQLSKKFWPGGLTILFEKSDRVPDLCTAGTPWVALRCPDHAVFQALLAKVGRPLAAPSANRFGRISPTSALDVVEELGAYDLQAVVDGGPSKMGVESTVVKMASQNRLEILRQGAITVEALRDFVGPSVDIVVSAFGSGMDPKKFESPGQLKSHYAPRTPLRLVEEEPEALSTNIAFLVCDGRGLRREWWGRKNFFCLSDVGSDVEAAAKVFATLRELDRRGFQGIWARLGPERGLFSAVNERLRKAAAVI